MPVHTLATTEDYLAVLDGHAQKCAPGERFSYSNSGFVVLALVAGRVAGRPFEELVAERVFEAAGMRSTVFLRSDELPGDAATGYLWADRARTNVLHLPVVGSDAGVSFQSVQDPASATVWTVVSNTSDGAWPVARVLRETVSAPRAQPETSAPSP